MYAHRDTNVYQTLLIITKIQKQRCKITCGLSLIVPTERIYVNNRDSSSWSGWGSVKCCERGEHEEARSILPLSPSRSAQRQNRLPLPWKDHSKIPVVLWSSRIFTGEPCSPHILENCSEFTGFAEWGLTLCFSTLCAVNNYGVPLP